eukprot:4822072-Alexandrium_andersonii.AAC.1
MVGRVGSSSLERAPGPHGEGEERRRVGDALELMKQRRAGGGAERVCLSVSLRHPAYDKQNVCVRACVRVC